MSVTSVASLAADCDRLGDLLDLRPRSTATGSWVIPDISVAEGRRFSGGPQIEVLRSPTEGPDGTYTYAVQVPTTGIQSPTAQLSGPDNLTVGSTWKAP